MTSENNLQAPDKFRFFLALGASALVACSQKVVVDHDFPEPALEPLPMVVGVYYPDSLANFVHIETPPREATWTLELGKSNVKLFESIFGSLFKEVVLLDESRTVPAGVEVDAILIPTLEEVEFTLPRQSGKDQYAVWLRYNLKVLTPDGELITDFEVPAYGQAGAKTMGGDKSMQRAAELAMRDAAANIAMNFGRSPAIRDQLLTDASDEKT